MTDRRDVPASSERVEPWAHGSLDRWRRASAVAAVAMLTVLAWAPTKEFLQPWRGQRARYNALAQQLGIEPVEIQVHQIWIPGVEKADRCGTCHLAAVGVTPIDGYPLFEAHPPVPHEPQSIGCTYCHSGQGRATVAADAHGEGEQWPHPIFARERTEAGCGTCHSGIDVPLPENTEDAEELTEEFGCLECHQEGSDAPDIVAVALRGVPEDWVRRHDGLIFPEDASPLSGSDEYDLETLNAWLATRIGAPHLARGKMVFHQLGCLGCHRRGGVGGDVGPDLTQIGDADARELSSEDVLDSETLPRWLQHHLLRPQEMVAGSRMPPVDVEELEEESDIDDLVTYLLSLRGENISHDLVPPDRARVLFGLGRDIPTTGRGLFETFCSSCHGTEGEGREMETLGMVTPMVGSRGVLATVTPRYLRESILRGRRGRYMPSWGPEDGGLSVEEIDDIVDYLASRAFSPPPVERLSGTPDPVNGRRVFEERCAFCHGRTDSPSRFGVDLLQGDVLEHFTDRDLLGAITLGWVEEGMPAFAFLPAVELRDLIGYLRRAAGRSVQETVSADGLHSHVGHQLWLAKCDGCHGANGDGGAGETGPILNTDPYLRWVGDGYLASRILDHRGRQARDEIGTPSTTDIEALLDYMRSWSGMVSLAPSRNPDLEAAARGRELYPSRCAECHGAEGRGGTSTALASADFLAVVTRPFLVMTILQGRSGTPMVAWREQQEKPVSLSDAFDLADYILSLGESGSQLSPTRRDQAPGDQNQGG